MNKYIEAFNRIVDYAPFAVHDDLLELRELVEKATPNKPKRISITHEGRVGNCPSCNKLVTEFDSKPNICECGQRLDWSKEDE